MSQSAALQAFIAEELERMPALIEQVRRQTMAALMRSDGAALSADERTQRFNLAQALDRQAGRFDEAFVAALRKGVSNALLDQKSPVAPPPRGLALLDESEHNEDVEVARVVAQIGGVAEWELRELQTFTSALSGLPYVSVSSNPLRPDAFADALWQAAGSVAPARLRTLLLRAGAGALAASLRQALAAACTRLEAQGIQPSLYRTAVPRSGESARISTLSGLLERLPASPPPKRAATPPVAQAVEADAQITDMLNRLFGAITRDAQLHPTLRALTGLLQASALRLALRDPALLDLAGHPLWQLLDRFAFQSATHPDPADPQLLAWVAFASETVVAMQAEPIHDAAPYQRAVEQLDAYAAAQFNAQLQQAAGEIASLRESERHPDTSTGRLDFGSMETVPADLLSSAPSGDADATAAQWVDQQLAGNWFRLFLRSRWTVTRLLWRSDSASRWVLFTPNAHRKDVVDRTALIRLRAEGLLRPMTQRAVVLRAAESVLRQMSEGGPAGG